MTDITWVATIITALGGWKLVEYLLNRHNIKRLTAAEAIQKEMETIMVDYRRMAEKVATLERKVDELYAQLHKKEDECLALIKRNNELEVALKEAEKHVCLQPDDRCLRRLNTNDHCRLRNILRGEYVKDHPDAIITEEDMLETDKNETDGISEKSDKG